VASEKRSLPFSVSQFYANYVSFFELIFDSSVSTIRGSNLLKRKFQIGPVTSRR
jgi:hypothetical protein